MSFEYSTDFFYKNAKNTKNTKNTSKNCVYLFRCPNCS